MVDMYLHFHYLFGIWIVTLHFKYTIFYFCIYLSCPGSIYCIPMPLSIFAFHGLLDISLCISRSTYHFDSLLDNLLFLDFPILYVYFPHSTSHNSFLHLSPHLNRYFTFHFTFHFTSNFAVYLVPYVTFSFMFHFVPPLYFPLLALIWCTNSLCFLYFYLATTIHLTSDISFSF